RDVLILGHYAYIAASEQGVVVVDITHPDLPVVDVFDTLGVANRLAAEGNLLYVANMAGSGTQAQLNVIDISDPHNLRHVFAYELSHGREDFEFDSIYDLKIIAGLAYVTVNYSDQEDKPAQSSVEIIDTSALRSFEYFETRNAVTHRKPTSADVGARGVALAYDEIYEAAGRQGLKQLELNSLTVISHTPDSNDQNVAADLAAISIRISHPVDISENYQQYISVWSGLAGFGQEVTDLFDISVSAGDVEGDSSRLLVLTRKNSEILQYNTRYVVHIEPGMQPITGGAMAQSYEFSFTTIADPAAEVPVIETIAPATVSTQGGDLVEIFGYGFADIQSVTIGGRDSLISSAEVIDAEHGQYRVTVIAPANYAGPATLEITNKWSITATVVGAVTYVDDLRVSFVNPAVVHVNQDGVNDRSEIIGYGFSRSTTVTAYPFGQKEKAITDYVDNDRLILKSAERMLWTLPDFGKSFRGFVTIEVVDGQRKVVIPQAVFFGAMVTGARIETRDKPPVDMQDDYSVQPSLLPYGQVVDIEADTDLQLFYVLGRAPQASLSGINNELQLNQGSYRGWLALVHYERDDLGNAAPMHGLGYYDMPADLAPQTMQRHGDYLYVVAKGRRYAGFDTTYEGRDWLLVYRTVKRLPGDSDGTEQAEGEDRNFITAIPLPTDNGSEFYTEAQGDLLIVAERNQGIHLLSLAN